MWCAAACTSVEVTKNGSGRCPPGPQMPEIRALTIFTSVAADRCPASSSKIFLNVGMAWMWSIEIGMVQIAVVCHLDGGK
jgi:hypothetical protein